MALTNPDVDFMRGWTRVMEWYDVDLFTADLESAYIDLPGPSLVFISSVRNATPDGTGRQFSLELTLDASDSDNVFVPYMAHRTITWATTYDFASNGNTQLITSPVTTVDEQPVPLDGNEIRWKWATGTTATAGSLHALRMSITPVAQGR